MVLNIKHNVKLLLLDVTKSPQPETNAPSPRNSPKKSATAQDGDFHLVIHGGARALAQLRWIIRDLGRHGMNIRG